MDTTALPLTAVSRVVSNQGHVLAKAANDGDAELVTILLAQGHSRNRAGTPGLFRAAANNHGAVVTLLLESRADPDAPDAGGGTALHTAAREGHDDALRRLISGGADLDVRDREYGRTALHYTASHGMTSCAARLLAA